MINRRKFSKLPYPPWVFVIALSLLTVITPLRALIDSILQKDKVWDYRNRMAVFLFDLSMMFSYNGPTRHNSSKKAH